MASSVSPRSSFRNVEVVGELSSIFDPESAVLGLESSEYSGSDLSFFSFHNTFR
jgi:hypothetical protein